MDTQHFDDADLPAFGWVPIGGSILDPASGFVKLLTLTNLLSILCRYHTVHGWHLTPKSRGLPLLFLAFRIIFFN